MMTKERQTYDKEFKQKAVELSFARGNAREIAEELGIRPELLYRWRREHQKYQNNSFPGKGRPKMTKSSYYRWLSEGPSRRWQENERLLVEMVRYRRIIFHILILIFIMGILVRLALETLPPILISPIRLVKILHSL